MTKHKTFASKVIDFNRNLNYSGELPDGFQVLNPYLDSPETMEVMQQFYYKYYNDNHPRKFIMGINTSRNGAGGTGKPFTDTQRLKLDGGTAIGSPPTHGA